jgi:hypothetical protein
MRGLLRLLPLLLLAAVAYFWWFGGSKVGSPAPGLGPVNPLLVQEVVADEAALAAAGWEPVAADGAWASAPGWRLLAFFSPT